MHDTPLKEDRWLDPLVGEWDVDSEFQTATDKPPTKMCGRLTCRSLGGLWLVMDGTGDSPGSGMHTSILTLGYDLQQNCYIGTFVASMMTHLWLYTDGSVDEFGKKLILNVEGPSFDQTGLAKYQDIIDILDLNHWVLSSQVFDAGKWIPFMTAHHRRAK